MEVLNKTVKVISAASSLLSAGSLNFSISANVAEGGTEELGSSRHATRLRNKPSRSRRSKTDSHVHGRSSKRRGRSVAPSKNRSKSSSRRHKPRSEENPSSKSAPSGDDGSNRISEAQTALMALMLHVCAHTPSAAGTKQVNGQEARDYTPREGFTDQFPAATLTEQELGGSCVPTKTVQERTLPPTARLSVARTNPALTQSWPPPASVTNSSTHMALFGGAPSLKRQKEDKKAFTDRMEKLRLTIDDWQSGHSVPQYLVTELLELLEWLESPESKKAKMDVVGDHSEEVSKSVALKLKIGTMLTESVGTCMNILESIDLNPLPKDCDLDFLLRRVIAIDSRLNLLDEVGRTIRAVKKYLPEVNCTVWDSRFFRATVKIKSFSNHLTERFNQRIAADKHFTAGRIEYLTLHSDAPRSQTLEFCNVAIEVISLWKSRMLLTGPLTDSRNQGQVRDLIATFDDQLKKIRQIYWRSDRQHALMRYKEFLQSNNIIANAEWFSRIFKGQLEAERIYVNGGFDLTANVNAIARQHIPFTADGQLVHVVCKTSEPFNMQNIDVVNANGVRAKLELVFAAAEEVHLACAAGTEMPGGWHRCWFRVVNMEPTVLEVCRNGSSLPSSSFVNQE